MKDGWLFKDVDVSEKQLFLLYPGVLEKLLEDHASNKHIYWATDSYSDRGKGYDFFDEITINKVSGENDGVIRPRALKSKEERTARTKNKAEVFTPSWICNCQNNLVDDLWFGQSGLFNSEDNQTKSWTTNTAKIPFPTQKGKHWQDYVCENRLEITCGEAPYLASRYDTTTGLSIPVYDRIGLLDRKLRVVGENVKNMDDWFLWAFAALKGTYGYEWQGDSLLLARESVLLTFVDYHQDFALKCGLDSSLPSRSHLLHAAEIISWNLFQMDGLKMVLPMTCKEVAVQEPLSLFDEPRVKYMPCPGCKNEDYHTHNGIKQIVADWQKDKWSTDEKPIEIVEFHTLLEYK